MNTRKKTAFGILGATATAALAFGAATPALAGDDRGHTHGKMTHGDHTTTSTWSQYDYWTQRDTTLKGGDVTGGDLHYSNESPIVVAPEVSTGDILDGGILSGNANGNHVGSGNEVGNGNVVGSGNDTAIGSGNTTGITGVEGVDIDTSDLFDSTVGDITGDVSDLLDDIDVSLKGMFED